MFKVLFLLFACLQSIINPTADILFAGDAMMHEAQITAARQADGSYNYTDCFTEIAPIVKKADYAVVNLEAPLGGAPYKGYPCFSAPDSYATALRDAGFDLFLTANNHTLDCRDRGLTRTLSVLDTLNIPSIGTYRNKEERNTTLPYIANIKGFDVGFLNYTYGTNGISTTTDAVVDYIDPSLIPDDIAKTRNAGAEIIIVTIHWGEEYNLKNNSNQSKLASQISEAGADLIIGGHPHVVQPIDTVTTSDGRHVPVAYSLGNFISNMKTRDTRGGAIVNVTLARDSIGNAFVAEIKPQLVYTVRPEKGGENFRVVPAMSESVTPFQKANRNAFVKAAMPVIMGK